MTHFNRNSSHISLKYEIGYIFLHCRVKELASSPGLLSSFMAVIISVFWYLSSVLGLSL